MGRRRKKWKQLINTDSKEDTVNMIEHSINKHPIPITPTVSYMYQGQQRSNKHYTQEELEKYIKDCEDKGYKIGAKIVTRYDANGYISRVMIPPAIGLTCFGKENPDIFFITRQDSNMETSVGYNVEELTLI